ncbi:hypothetical protein PQX77_014199 [Marasmius sp. AFHP31]|nr:hypothetical protein PQX77_014199 [Marasmius sp. AFHP31]
MADKLFPSVAALEELDDQPSLHLKPLYSPFYVPPLLDKPQDPIIDTLKRSNFDSNEQHDRFKLPVDDAKVKIQPLELKIDDSLNRLVLDDVLDVWEVAVSRANAAQSQLRSWDDLQRPYSIPPSTTGFLSEQDSVMFAAARYHLHPQLHPEDTEILYVSKDDLLRSLKMTVLGASTSLHEWDPTSETFTNSVGRDGRRRTIIISGKDETISDSIMSTFLTIGTALRRLEKLVADVRARTSRTEATLHAFAHALSTCLGSIRRSLDNCSLKYDSMAGEDLCGILAEYEPHQQVLVALLSLCARIIALCVQQDIDSSPDTYATLPEKAQPFLSHLFDALDSHLERKSPQGVNAMIAFLLSEASQHYLYTVCRTVGYHAGGHPAISETFDEELHDFPNFFSAELASALPTTRRSLHLLRAARPDHPILREQQQTSVQWIWAQGTVEAAFFNRLRAADSARPFGLAAFVKPGGVQYKAELQQFRKFDFEPGFGIGFQSCFGRDDSNVPEVRLSSFVQAFPETLPAITPTLRDLATLILKPLLSHCSTLSSTLLSIFLSLPPPLNLQAHLKLMQSYMLLTLPSFKSRLSAALFSDSLDFTVNEKARQLFSLTSRRRAAQRSETTQNKVWAVGLAPALLERDIWPPIGADLNFFLRTVIYDSFDLHNGEEIRQREIEEVESRLGFAIRGSEGKDPWSDPLGIEALDFLYMDYKPPPPLDVVITNDIIFKYQRLFALLLRVIRAESATAAIFRMTRPSATPLFPTLAEPRKLLLHFRFIAQQFVGCISEYIYDTAIGGNFGPFLDKLHSDDKAQAPFPDVFSLAEAHSDTMDNILTACLSRTSQRATGALLRDCLNTILQFAVVAGELHRGRLKEYEAAPTIEDLYNRLRRKVASLVKALRVMVDKRANSSVVADASRTGHGPVGGVEALSQLLARLDLGNWWLKPE